MWSRFWFWFGFLNPASISICHPIIRSNYINRYYYYLFFFCDKTAVYFCAFFSSFVGGGGGGLIICLIVIYIFLNIIAFNCNRQHVFGYFSKLKTIIHQPTKKQTTTIIFKKITTISSISIISNIYGSVTFMIFFNYRQSS